MLVSIIIPVHKTIDYFKDCIQSVLSQTYSDFEVIIACNGNLEIAACKSFLDINDSRIIYIKTKQGRHNARNEALQHTKGTYIQYLDYDDILFPDKIKTQLEYFKEKSIGIVSIVKWKKFKEDTNEYYNFPFPYLFDDLYIETSDLIDKLGKSKGFLATASWLLPKKLIEDLYWTDSPNDDAVFFSELCKKKPHFVMIPETLAGYRIHDLNTSSIRTKQEFDKLLISWKMISQNLSVFHNKEKRLYLFHAYLYLIMYSKQIKKYKIGTVLFYSLLHGFKAGMKTEMVLDLKKRILN